MGGESAPDQIRRMMDAYLDAFARHDLARTMTHYRLPTVFITPNGIFQATDAAQLERLLRSYFATLDAQDHRASRWDELHVHLLAPSCAIVSTVFSRLRGDGSVIESLGGTYQLVIDDGVWKVLTLASHGPGSVLR